MQKKDEKRQTAPDMRKMVLLALALVLLAVLGYLFLQLRARTQSAPQNNAVSTVTPSLTPSASSIATPYPESLTVYVEIKGAVYKPGRYTLTKGQTVADALMLAGGPTERAVLNQEQMAQVVQTDMTIIIEEQ